MYTYPSEVIMALDALIQAKALKDQAAILQQSATEILIPYCVENNIKKLPAGNLEATYVAPTCRKKVDIAAFKNGLLAKGVDAVVISRCEFGATSATEVKGSIRLVVVKEKASA